MYFLIVILLLGIVPAGSVFYEHSYLHSTASLLFLIGKWFAFWGVGVRLFIAGLRQTIQPGFTAQEIFKVEGEAVYPIVREIGFANLSMSTLALLSLAYPAFLPPGALVGGLYYGFAGLLHVAGHERNAKENVAMISDLFIAVVLLGFIGLTIAANHGVDIILPH
ncbi:MAG TPA: hypothetical protein VG309_04360 [Rhizomicrobium sp.]|nr:hypothetical protein [Rhizomicrobium sp.]